MFRHLLAVSMILAIVSANCQQLRVKDKLPEIELTGILNWSADNLYLSALKKKLIILDFWSFSCLTCLNAFAEIDSLQREFQDDVQFIAVNNESVALTKKFIKNHPDIKFPDIPFVSGDTILSSFFPRAYSPWHVWMDSAFRVRYITDGHNATGNHIKSFLNGEALAVNQLKFDTSYLRKETILGDTELVKTIHAYSFIGRCMQEFNLSNFIGDTGEGTFKLSQHCKSVFELLKTAFGEGKYDFSFPVTCKFSPGLDSVFDYETRPDKIDQWTANHCYNYQRVMPLVSSGKIFKLMQQDMTSYFNIDAKVEKRPVECLSLQRINVSKPVQSANLRQLEKNNESQLYSKNGVKDFVIILNNLLFNSGYEKFIADDTGYDAVVSLTLDQKLVGKQIDLHKVNEALRKFNLRLLPKSFTTEVLIVNE